jgi:hypothetical protein
LRRILTDYEPVLEWAEQAIAAYLEGGTDEPRLGAWRWHLQRLLGSIGGVTGVDPRNEGPSPLRSATKPFQRGTVPLRDVRFETFKHTGDYDTADGQTRFPKESYENLRLRFIRTQRDEVDAIEAFGTFIWDIRFKDFQAEYDLARITWDETRHTEIGHRALQAAGYDPFELRNRLTGSTCRGPMDPAFAMAEINLFGEVGVLKTINGLIDTARARQDALLAHIADFIRADERTHVRKGTHILKCMTTLGAKELELRTVHRMPGQPRCGEIGHGCVHCVAGRHRAVGGRVKSENRSGGSTPAPGVAGTRLASSIFTRDLLPSGSR